MNLRSKGLLVNAELCRFAEGTRVRLADGRLGTVEAAGLTIVNGMPLLSIDVDDGNFVDVSTSYVTLISDAEL